MSAQVAVNILWGVWYVTWIGAVIWSGRTKTQMKTDIGGLHRSLSAIGVVLLFAPTPHPAGAPGLYVLLTGRLWRSVSPMDWSLFGFTLAAFGFCWWARLHLGRLWSGFVTLKEDHRIVDSGPYGLVRHPIYAGVMFAALATAAMRATPAALAGFALIAIGFSMTARIEERFLRQQLGADAYDSYSRRVGMLIPKMA